MFWVLVAGSSGSSISFRKIPCFLFLLCDVTLVGKRQEIPPLAQQFSQINEFEKLFLTKLGTIKKKSFVKLKEKEPKKTA